MVITCEKYGSNRGLNGDFFQVFTPGLKFTSFWIIFSSSICLIEYWIGYLWLYIQWTFYWMNISDLNFESMLNWIVFGPDSTFEWIFKMYRTGLCPRENFYHTSMSFEYATGPLWDPTKSLHYGEVKKRGQK